jgi:signal transduction histidine kinase
MGELAAALSAAQPVVYAVLAVATLERWLRLRDAASGWAAAMFVALGGAIGVGQLLPEDPGGSIWAQKAVIATLVLFPYLLFRFAATFRRPGPVLEAVAACLTVAAVGLVFLFSDLPDSDERPTAAFAAYTALVAVQWVGLSAIVASWLWRGGGGRPTVVRRRIRTLAVAVILLASALLLAVAVSGGDSDDGVAAVIVAGLAVAAGPLFLAGLAPPAVLLAHWRGPEEEELREAEAGLIAATSPAEVAGALLPYVARVMGGDAAVLSRADGSVIAYHGVDEAGADAVLAAADGAVEAAWSVTSVPMRTGTLAVAGDRYSPFFGRSEAKVLARFGSLTDVALRRAELTEVERASAAELKRAHTAMQEFLSIASHDLRTPIAVVKGYAATMITAWSSIPDADKLGYLETINRQADRLSRMVADLLTASQIDAGAIEPTIETVDLVEVVEEVIADLEHRHDVHLRMDGPLLVRADEHHSTRIVRNLVENAFHYGAPPVAVASRWVDGAVELTVRDHGAGVPEDFVPRLFDRFARDASASNRTKHGTGLGLSIVRGLAQAGGGDAWYEPASPGACFVVRFPPHEA